MIPDGKMYMEDELGAGMIASIEDYTALTEQTGADVGFGYGVIIQNGKVIPAAKGPIFGVALRRNWANVDHFYDSDIKNDKFTTGETITVLRDGIVAVPITADVNAGENAAVDANGGFKPAATGDTVVGVFVGNGDKGNTARLQTRIQLASSNADNLATGSQPVATLSTDTKNNSGSTSTGK